MPKVIKKAAVTKDITVMFEGFACTVEISKHFSPSEIYRAIHKALPPRENIRITNELNEPLLLRYENLKTTSKIYAHRLGDSDPASASQGPSGKKAAQQVAKIMQHWGLKDPEDILPVDLRPRERPLGKEMFATRQDVKMSISVLRSGDWPVAFVTALQNLSKLTVKEHEMAVEILRGIVAERHTSDEQHRKVYDVMTQELATEGLGLELFAGGLGEAIGAVEKEMLKGKEKEKEKGNKKVVAEEQSEQHVVLPPRTFVIACKSAVEEEDEQL
ncbi:hypothetical protein T440DRAFT_539631 [Plenodomus tracheiphilus IPT5]|uniref:Uncharacterized protein n=1 Tax=Plenodomus tracheiphilus IPT5 TaxID=1408161 RepID=A0A6A7BKM7_9PLEO|nr:hypothetical protein T440DRAFT_539631 [Plenodomus tracheiphilus IPT5]